MNQENNTSQNTDWILRLDFGVTISNESKQIKQTCTSNYEVMP